MPTVNMHWISRFHTGSRWGSMQRSSRPPC